MLTGRLKSILTITTIALFLPDRLVAGENNALLDVLKNSENRAKSIVNKHRISYSLLTNANPLNPK